MVPPQQYIIVPYAGLPQPQPQTYGERVWESWTLMTAPPHFRIFEDERRQMEILTFTALFGEVGGDLRSDLKVAQHVAANTRSIDTRPPLLQSLSCHLPSPLPSGGGFCWGCTQSVH